MITEEQFNKLLVRIQDKKTNGEVDLSLEEDLSMAIMNLVSLEEHFFFTGVKTGKDNYFDLMEEIREMRKSLLGRMMPANEGETWCISKHLLAATMRLIEVGTKLQSDKNKSEAAEMFRRAYHLYAIFWALRLKLIDLNGVKKIDADKLNIHDPGGKTKPWSVEDIVEKLVNCCDE